MPAIGFRIEPAAVHYAIVEGSADAPILVSAERFSAPKSWKEAEALSWYRTRTKLVLGDCQPDKAAIKYMESVAGRGGSSPRWNESAQRRHRIEGVVLQLLHEQGIATVTGPFSTVSSRLGSRSAKSYVDMDDLRGLDWSSKSRLAREAILTAVAALGR